MSSGFYQDGFDYTFEFEPSKPLLIGADTFEDVIPVKVYCEPDESVADTDWYIAAIYLDLNGGIELDKNDEGVQSLMHHAYSVERDHIQSKWEDWLWDRPRSRSSRYERVRR